MLYRSYAPPPPLRDSVTFWSLTDTPAHTRERIVPSGTLELVINLDDAQFRIYDPHEPEAFARFSGAIVSGAFQRPFEIDTRDHASIIGVHFTPGAAFAMLGVPPGGLADMHVDLESLWGSTARSLREQLCDAPGPAERFRLLEHVLLRRPVRPAHPAIRIALDLLGQNVRVREVAARVGLSHRRFIEVFTEEVGMTPKVFSRVKRFQRAVRLLQSAHPPAWTDLATHVGYFDQSHLIRDFVSFSGFSPVEFVRRRSDRVKEHHLPLFEA